MDEIYQKYARTVYKYLLTLVHNQDIAEELTQETFYQAIRCIDNYNGKCAISTWLCAIAKNQYLTYQRKHPDMENIEDYEQKINSAEKDALESVDRVELLKRLHQCSEPYREVLYLRIFGNLSFKEIGEIMDKSENWARVTFYRGKDKFRKEFDANEK